jgi:hypothetical protein
MTKRNLTGKLFALLLVMLALPAFATEVPHTLNFQSVLFDDSGKLVPDGTMDLEFKILDADGQEIYSELQPAVQVVRGSVNVMMGEGLDANSKATNGIPLSAFDPTTGAKTLEMKIGNNQPTGPMAFGTVPYSMYAEEALTVAPNSIGSEQIKNGSIKVEDLEPGLTFGNINGQLGDSQLPTSAATVSQLNAHISSTTAHPASSITLTGPFTFSSMNDVQSVIRDLDKALLSAITNNSINKVNINNALTTHTTSTAAHGSDGNVVGANTLANAIATHAALTTGVHGLSSTPGNKIVGTADAQTLTNKTLTAPTLNTPTINGGTVTSDLAVSNGVKIDGVDISDFYATATSGLSTLTTNLSTETTNRTTAESGLSSAISSEASVREAADTDLKNNKVSKSGDVMSGDLNMNGHDITNAGSDLWTVGSKISNHETRLFKLENKGPVDLTTATGQVSAAQVPQFMRPLAYGYVMVDCVISMQGAYNASVSSRRINFASPVPVPYIVITSSGTTITNRDTNGFNFTPPSTGCSGQAGAAIDFIVYSNS